MILKNFRFQCIARVLLMTLTMAIGLSLMLLGNYLFSSIILFILLFLQTYDLINYVERTNIKLAHLVSSIENSDFSQQFFDDRKNSALAELVNAMNSVISRFGENRRSREEALHFLGTVLEKSPVAILVYEDSGQITWTNSSLLNLLETEKMAHIKTLENSFPELYAILNQEKNKSELQVRTSSRLKYLSVRINKFGLYGKTMHLLTLQNIHQELDTRESESWEKLMRVLTHEIMNSITPIISLSESANQLVSNAEFKGKKEIAHALTTIRERGNGLLNFTKRYRQVLQIPKPQAQKIKLLEPIEHSLSLFQKFSHHRIELDIPEQLFVYADEIMLQQVLINLLKNSQEAIPQEREAKISISAYTLKNRTVIDIMDNGKGINNEDLDQVFVPFFTNKEGGSGIGLSLSREMIRAMGGILRVAKSNDKGTIMQILL